MKKVFRLTKSSDFKKVLDNRKRIDKSDSIYFFYKNNLLKHIRIGISVSTKIGNAVIRSTCRRKIRAIIDLINPYILPFDVVIIVKEKFLTSTFVENKQTLLNQFTTLKQLNGEQHE